MFLLDRSERHRLRKREAEDEAAEALDEFKKLKDGTAKISDIPFSSINDSDDLEDYFSKEVLEDIHIWLLKTVNDGHDYGWVVKDPFTHRIERRVSRHRWCQRHLLFNTASIRREYKYFTKSLAFYRHQSV